MKVNNVKPKAKREIIKDILDYISYKIEDVLEVSSDVNKNIDNVFDQRNIVNEKVYSKDKIGGNLPKPHNSNALAIETPQQVRRALNKKYPNLSNKYCDDYRALSQYEQKK